jgi:hypothetical protein
VNYVQSGFGTGGKNREKLALFVGYVLGNLGSLITINY